MKSKSGRKSVVPFYSVAAVSALWAAFLPLHTALHFILLVFSCAIAFLVSSLITASAAPVLKRASETDDLISEGNAAVGELRGIKTGIIDGAVAQKMARLVDTVERIFLALAKDVTIYREVRRFTDLYLNPVVKLCREYAKAQDIGGGSETVHETMRKIDSALDTVNTSFEKFLEALFKNGSLDIETDIAVIEHLLTQDGIM